MNDRCAMPGACLGERNTPSGIVARQCRIVTDRGVPLGLSGLLLVFPLNGCMAMLGDLEIDL